MMKSRRAAPAGGLTATPAASAASAASGSAATNTTSNGLLILSKESKKLRAKAPLVPAWKNGAGGNNIPPVPAQQREPTNSPPPLPTTTPSPSKSGDAVAIDPPLVSSSSASQKPGLGKTNDKNKVEPSSEETKTNSTSNSATADGPKVAAVAAWDAYGGRSGDFVSVDPLSHINGGTTMDFSLADHHHPNHHNTVLPTNVKQLEWAAREPKELTNSSTTPRKLFDPNTGTLVEFKRGGGAQPPPSQRGGYNGRGGGGSHPPPAQRRSNHHTATTTPSTTTTNGRSSKNNNGRTAAAAAAPTTRKTTKKSEGKPNKKKVVVTTTKEKESKEPPRHNNIHVGSIETTTTTTPTSTTTMTNELDRDDEAQIPLDLNALVLNNAVSLVAVGNSSSSALLPSSNSHNIFAFGSNSTWGKTDSAAADWGSGVGLMTMTDPAAHTTTPAVSGGAGGWNTAAWMD
jgi:hypothetical protein